ncbi:hypothetical protein R3I94_020500 [Phoxinus phoxinus]
MADELETQKTKKKRKKKGN